MTSFVKKGLPINEQGKLDLTPRKHHGWTGFIMVLGFLLPPLAVAARFGIGSDFFINCICTLCGYFPGHGHNFFVQNIRNNENKKRTPKWAVKYGLVDDSDAKRLKRNRQWASRYNERSTQRVFYDDEGNVFTEQDPRAARPRRQRPGAERYLGGSNDDLDINGGGGRGKRKNKSSRMGRAGTSSSSISRISTQSSINGAPSGRDPYAAERRAAERAGGSGRSRGGAQMGEEFLSRDDDASSVYGPPSGRDPYEAERESAQAPKKKGWFKKSDKSAGPANGDFINPPHSASRDFAEEPIDPRDPYAAERRAAQRGEQYDPSRQRGGAGGSSRRNGGPQLGDEFLN
ncbi:hypothetical protein OC835_000114 [Tilletia horrida]|uniref:Uncharacterized protein n=1 Tax=Tilletia horrida TaxID=155126 RepID=A0AAN6GFW4_9BASI|nr:hypothetical protein OC842_001739 [Tilletia horrida]KAK0541465.1 hypothetical protein OC835_000114 [Tilletia horrida]